MKQCPVIFKPANEQDRKEFIEWLEKCGYDLNAYRVLHSSQIELNPHIATYGKHVATCGEPLPNCIYYDCKSNLPLAKALSALDDETKYNQWVVLELEDGALRWFLWRDKNATTMARCATKEELITQFAE